MNGKCGMPSAECGTKGWRIGTRALSRSDSLFGHSALRTSHSAFGRGGAIVMVLVLTFVLLAAALTTLSVVAASAAAVERGYRSSQALALAEAGLALAQAQAEPASRASASRVEHRFDDGTAVGNYVPRGGGWDLEGVGSVRTPAGATIERRVRADLERRNGRWVVLNWREEGAR